MLTDSYDAVKLVNVIEIKDVDGDEGQVNLLGLVTPSMIHTSPIFTGPVGSKIPLQDGVLDLGRHSTINFKVNSTSASRKSLKGNNSLGSRKGTPVGRGCGFSGKVYLNRNEKLFNKTIRGSSERFKATGNSHVQFLDLMNSMVKLINSQIEVAGNIGAFPWNGNDLENGLAINQ
ncbi:hypothetical protein PVK06_024252 [Gossypium arboreum]|uniref:Uncharacterized protein n=1 Tax=Gossypium arboreum TaxID=29729 RepID=A0ABR0PDM4_GOSAR|nr:hypothetical protein PVK06_024252 [Gossypium arboreum]